MNIVPVPNTLKTPQINSGSQSEVAVEIQVSNCLLYLGASILLLATISVATLLNLKSITHFMNKDRFTWMIFMVVAYQDLYV